MLLVGRTCIHRGWHVHTKWQLALHANHDRVLNSTYQEDKATSIYTKKKLAHVSLICSFRRTPADRWLAVRTHTHRNAGPCCIGSRRVYACICVVFVRCGGDDDGGKTNVGSLRFTDHHENLFPPIETVLGFVLTLWVPWKPLDEPTGYGS